MKLKLLLLLSLLIVGLFNNIDCIGQDPLETQLIISRTQLRDMTNISSPEDKGMLIYKVNESKTYLDDNQIKIVSNSFLKFVYKNKIVPLYDGFVSVGNIDFRSYVDNDYQKDGYLLLGQPFDTLEAISDTQIVSGELNIDNGYLLKSVETTYVEDIYTGELMEMIRDNKDILSDVFYGFGFLEKWSFYPETGKFFKNISYINLINYSIRYDDYYGETGLTVLRVLGDGFIKMPVFDKPIMPTKIENGKIFTDKNLLADSLVYDVRISFIDPGIDDYGPTSDYPEINNNLLQNDKFLLISNIFKALKEGKIKAYNVSNGKIDRSHFLAYNEVINSLNFTTRTVKVFDNEKMKKYQKIDIQPHTVDIYKLDEWGNTVYDYNDIEEFVPVVIDKITEYDTVWVTETKYLKIVHVRCDTIINYKYDEFGEYVYDDNWNIVVENKVVKYDTIYDFSDEMINDISATVDETYYHNNPDDINFIRFYETWYFDQDNFSLFKKVNGISFLIKRNWPFSEENSSKYSLNQAIDEYLVKDNIYFELNQ
ncbi:MAG: hypothetical protein ABIJ97_14555 [Bacteroidota bacterium]